MNPQFEEYLMANNVDEETVLETFRTYVSEQLDYKPPEDMKEELRLKASAAEEIEQLLEAVAQDRAALSAAAHLALGIAWENTGQQEIIKDTITTTKSRLPVIELSILAIVSMYAMYLITTGGISEKTKTTVKPDGSIETEQTKYEPPTGPLKSIVNLFRLGK